MTYPEQCQQMEKAGWISHAIACCNIDFSAKKRCTMRLLKSLRTYQAFEAGQKPPILDASQAVAAKLHFTDGKHSFKNAFLVDVTSDLVSAASHVPGQRLIGFLSDIPPGHLVYDQQKPKLLQEATQLLPVQATLIASDLDAPPDRIATTIERIIRDTEKSRRVKALHGYKCQLCGESVPLGGGKKYAEAHHIRPLGGDHQGPDTTDNILCVCPNHHAALDFRSFRLEFSKLRILPEHSVSREHIDYHNHLFEKKRREGDGLH